MDKTTKRVDKKITVFSKVMRQDRHFDAWTKNKQKNLNAENFGRLESTMPYVELLFSMSGVDPKGDLIMTDFVFSSPNSSLSSKDKLIDSLISFQPNALALVLDYYSFAAEASSTKPAHGSLSEQAIYAHRKEMLLKKVNELSSHKQKNERQ